MNRLYLVRHGRTLIDPHRHHSEWELDPEGTALLGELAALPHWASAYRIVSSSEPKAVKTAEAIARGHSLPPVETLGALKELHKGSFSANHNKAMESLFQLPDQPVEPGWETAQSALSRLSAALDRLIAEAAGRDLIVVSHGIILSLYLAALQGKDRVQPAEWRQIGMPDYCTIDTCIMKVLEPFGVWPKAQLDGILP